MFYFTEDVIIAPWFLYVVTYVIILVNFAFGSAFIYYLWSALINESSTLNTLHARCVLCQRKQSRKCTNRCCPQYMERRHARKLHKEVEREGAAAVRVKTRRGSSLWSTSSETVRARRKARELRIKKNQKQKNGRTLEMAPIPLAAEFARRRKVAALKNKKAEEKIKKRKSARSSIFEPLGKNAVKNAHVNPMLMQAVGKERKKEEKKKKKNEHVVQQHPDSESGEVHVDQPLPLNWDTEYDETEGVYFFYHVITGETSWDRPTVEQHDEDDCKTITPVVNWSKLNEGKVTSNILYDENVDKCVRAPGSSLSETVGSDSYSFGESTLEYEEEEPDKTNQGVADIKMQAATSTSIQKKFKKSRRKRKKIKTKIKQQNDSDMSESVKIDVDNVVDPLPPNWDMEYDEGERSYFYFNESTQETTWERPAVMKREDDEEGGNAVEIDPGDGVDDNSLPPHWEMISDDEGDHYYFNDETEATTWIRPTPTCT